MLRAHGKIHAILQHYLHLLVLLLVVHLQHPDVLGQDRHPLAQLVVLVGQQGVIAKGQLKVALQLPEPHQELLLYHWFVDVHWIFHRNLDWHLNDALSLHRLFYVNWLVDVDGPFHDRRHFNSNGLHHLLLHLSYHLKWHLLLNLDVLWNLHHSLHHSFALGTRNRPIDQNLNRLFYYHLFHDFPRSPLHQTGHLIFSLFQQSSREVEVDRHLVVLGLQFGDQSLLVRAGLVLCLEVLQLQAQSCPFLFRFFELLLQFLHFLEQLLEAIFALVVFLYLDLNLFAADAWRGGVGGQVFYIDFFIPSRDGDGDPRLHFSPGEGVLLFDFQLFE